MARATGEATEAVVTGAEMLCDKLYTCCCCCCEVEANETKVEVDASSASERIFCSSSKSHIKLKIARLPLIHKSESIASRLLATPSANICWSVFRLFATLSTHCFHRSVSRCKGGVELATVSLESSRFLFLLTVTLLGDGDGGTGVLSDDDSSLDSFDSSTTSAVKST